MAFQPALSSVFDWDVDDQGTRVFDSGGDDLGMDTTIVLSPDELLPIDSSFEGYDNFETDDVLERVEFQLGGLEVVVPEYDGRWLTGQVLCAHPSG